MGFVNTTYIPPPFGNARCSSITAFSSAVTGSTYLGLADYESGYVYVFDGNTNDFITVEQPNSPALFGSWMYEASNSVAPSGSTWIDNDAYSSTYSLSISVTSSGVLSEFPNGLLSYTVAGEEVLTLNVKLINTLPSVIFTDVYDSTTSSWHAIWWGEPSNPFPSRPATYLGPIPTIYNQWIGLPITVHNLNLTANDVLTAVGFGVQEDNGICTVIFSDFSSTATGLTTLLHSYNWVCPGGPGERFNGSLAAFSKDLYQVNIVYNPLQVYDTALELSGIVFCGATFVPNVDLVQTMGPYTIDNNGVLYWCDGSPSPFIINSSPPYMTNPYGLVNDAIENLYTLFPNSNAISTYNIPNNIWSSIASPFDVLSAISYTSGVGVTIGGGNLISLAKNVSGMAYSSLSQQLLISDYTDNEIVIYDLILGGWSLTQTISGIIQPSYIHMAPNQSQALVVSTSGLYALSAIGPAWASSVVSGVTGVTSLDLLNPNGIQALVTQYSSNKVTILNQAGTSWTSGQVLTIGDPTYIAVLGNNSGAIVASSSGLVQLINNDLSGIWSIGETLSFSPSPVAFLTDQENLNNPYIYAIQNSGGNIIVTAINSDLTVINSYTISSETYNSGLVINYQVFINELNGHINAGTIIGNLTQQTDLGSIGISTSGVSTAWVVNPTDFINLIMMGAGDSILEYYNNKSLLLARTYDSLVATTSGASGWNSIDLNNRNAVAAITGAPSGLSYAITTDNQLYQFSSTALSSGWPNSIQVPLDQESGVPIGLSSLVWYNNKLYASSSLYGGLISINPASSG